MKILFVCLLFLVVAAVADAKGKKGKKRGNGKGDFEDFEITFTVVNEEVEPHFTNVFSGSVKIPKDSTPKLIDIMNKIAEINDAFSFESETHDTLGEFITAMNGQSQVKDENLYWLVLREETDDEGETTRCYLPTGASTYEPRSGERIVWVLMEWDESIPTCDGGSHE